MKDQLTTVMEAVRLTRNILAEYVEHPRDHAAVLRRVIGVMDNRNVVEALTLLDPSAESPRLVPDQLAGGR